MAIQALEQAPDTVLVKCARRAGQWVQAAMLRTREGGFARRTRTSAPVLVQQADNALSVSSVSQNGLSLSTKTQCHKTDKAGCVMSGQHKMFAVLERM